MNAIIDGGQQQAMIALRSLILGLIDCEVIQGLGNGAPMPLGGFIAITPILKTRLSTNVATYTGTTKTTKQATRFDVQIDAYGPLSGDWASILSTMLRDDYACAAMGPSVQPLHADDPHMSPLMDGEQNYTQRWTLTASLQINPAVTVAQDSAIALQVDLLDVDAYYKP